MTEHLVIFESDIDKPRWFVVNAYTARKARVIAKRMLVRQLIRDCLGEDWAEWYEISVVVSR